MTATIKPAERMSRIPFSGIRQIFRRAMEHERQGKRVIHLEIGRPDFDTPAHIKEAAKQALDEGFVHYTPNEGILPLRQAIADRLARENGLQYDPEGEIMVTIGAAESIFVTLAAFLNPGDEVLVPEPAWLNYFHCARLVGASPVSIPLRADNHFRPDPDDLKKAITPRTKMLLINSPHNPTGAILDRPHLEAIAQVACQHDLLVVSDEIYDKIIYDGQKHISLATLPGMAERTITVNGFSKAYSMTGWRLGYLAAPEELCQAMIRVHQYSVTSATSFAQCGAVAAYTGSQEESHKMVAEFDRRRQLLLSGLAEIEGLSFVRPQGAFYIFPSLGEVGLTSVEFANYLMDEAYVAVVPGSTFGPSGEGFFRIAYSNSYEAIEEALTRLKKVWQFLRDH